MDIIFILLALAITGLAQAILSIKYSHYKKIDIDKDLEEKVNKLIEERNKYKEQKNYEKADEIRKQIEDLGVQIKDTREGTKIIWM